MGIGRSSRIWRAASIPSSRGILTSSTARSGRSVRDSSTASMPSLASAQTSNPARSSSCLRSSRMIVSSSAIRILTAQVSQLDTRNKREPRSPPTSRPARTAGSSATIARVSSMPVLNTHSPRGESSGWSPKGPQRSSTPRSCRSRRWARCCSWISFSRSSGRSCASGGLRRSTNVWRSSSGGALIPVQRLREHPCVAVGIVEGRQLDHAFDLVRVAVETRVQRLEVLAGSVDVLDAEGRHRAAMLQLLDLAEPDRDPAPRSLDLAPAVLLEAVLELEAERLPVPLDRGLEVGHVDGDDELPVVIDRRRRLLGLGLSHRCLLSFGHRLVLFLY